MRSSFARVLTLLVTAVAAAYVMSSPASARPTSARGSAKSEVRLATIAYRIAAANASTCRTREVITGLVLHDLSRYDRSVRDAVSRAFSVGTGFGVIGVIPGSVAADAGLQIDDEILAVGLFTVEDTAARDRPRSFRRMEQFNATLQAAGKDETTELLVRRRGNLLHVLLRARYGCGGNLTLSTSSIRNAWADGKHIVVTTGMADLARSDDEIAFVIAHEMAHNILEHSREAGGKRGSSSARVRRGEIEADSLAVRLMSNGGYQPAGGISFLQNARRRLWWSIPLDRPGFGRRIEIVTAAALALITAPTTKVTARSRR